MSENIFEHLLDIGGLFKNREVLHHGFTPNSLPHRDSEIQALAFNLREALEGHIPSNMLLYGQPGSGKTAATRFVYHQMLEMGAESGRSVNAIEVNCCTVDTKYRVLAHIANSLTNDRQHLVPFTGWPTDKVFDKLRENMDRMGGVHVLVLDEIDHLIEKNGDDILYLLTNLNYQLRQSKCCIIGITNDLQFTDMLDARIASRLGSEDLVFSPYLASHIEDILELRARAGVREGALEAGVVQLCAALAAQEHGDARRALDLLRIAVQKAELGGGEVVGVQHVRQAQSQLDFDQITPVIAGLPFHQKLVLYSVLLNESNGLNNISSGEVYSVYQMCCNNASVSPLVSRSVNNVVKNLDSLGLITAKAISLGRYGRSNRINSCIPQNIDAVAIMKDAEEDMESVVNASYRLQSRL